GSGASSTRRVAEARPSLETPLDRRDVGVARVLPEQHDGVLVLADDVFDTDVLRAEAVIRVVDVVRIVDRLAEDERGCVVWQDEMQRSAGRRARHEVELAIDPHGRVLLQAGPRLRERVEAAAAAAAGGRAAEQGRDGEALHGASVYGSVRRPTAS